MDGVSKTGGVAANFRTPDMCAVPPEKIAERRNQAELPPAERVTDSPETAGAKLPDPAPPVGLEAAAYRLAERAVAGDHEGVVSHLETFARAPERRARAGELLARLTYYVGSEGEPTAMRWRRGAVSADTGAVVMGLPDSLLADPLFGQGLGGCGDGRMVGELYLGMIGLDFFRTDPAERRSMVALTVGVLGSTEEFNPEYVTGSKRMIAVNLMDLVENSPRETQQWVAETFTTPEQRAILRDAMGEAVTRATEGSKALIYLGPSPEKVQRVVEDLGLV